MSRPGRLWCARHAPVAVTGVCYGRSDVPLRIGAEEAASILARALAREGAAVSRVWSSSAARTRSVAAILAARAGVPLRVDDRIAELSMGEWEGRAFVDLERTDAVRFARWMEAWRTEAPPGGETLAELTARVGAWTSERLIELAAAPEADAIAVTHAGVIRALRAGARGLTYEEVLASDPPVPHLELERVAEA